MNSRHYAVVVGIDCYPGVANQLSTAKHDASAFAEWLRDPLGGALPDNNVALITATPEEESAFKLAGPLGATRARPILNDVYVALETFHAAVSRLNDPEWQQTRLYMYLAGHGIVPAAGNGALLFANARPPGFWGDVLDFVAYAQLYERFTPFHDIIMLSDCCREINEGVPSAAAPPFSGKVRGLTNCVTGYAALFGSNAGAVPSSGSGGHGRGFFTQAILEGLKGAAPHDPVTGAIGSHQLHMYVDRRVPQLSSQNNYSQQAYIQRMRGDVEFTRVAVRRFRARVVASLRFPAGSTVCIRDAALNVILGPSPARHPPEYELPNGLYEAVVQVNGELTEELASSVFRVRDGDLVVTID